MYTKPGSTVASRHCSVGQPQKLTHKFPCSQTKSKRSKKEKQNSSWRKQASRLVRDDLICTRLPACRLGGPLEAPWGPLEWSVFQLQVHHSISPSPSLTNVNVPKYRISIFFLLFSSDDETKGSSKFCSSKCLVLSTLSFNAETPLSTVAKMKKRPPMINSPP